MRKKLFTFLLALVTSVGLSWATVITWDASKVSSMAMNVSSGSDSRTSDGITVTVVSTGEFVVFGDLGGAIEIGNGEGSGGGYLTFTSSVGNIAQIDIYHSGAGEWSNANGDWISPYYENFEGGIFTWSGTPAASITLTGDAPRHIDGITSIEFTIEDGGGSAQAGLQVTELDVPSTWEDNPTMLSTSDMPGFVAITKAEAQAWDAAPAGNVVLIFAFEENAATSLYFKNGVCQPTQAYNITYEDLYAWYLNGDKIFYTGGGSTPEPSETTVTWDLSDMESMGTQGGYFKAKGITLMAYGVDNGMTGYGSHEGAFFGGPFVFTTSLGKFTKIEVTNSYLYDQPAFSGDGWTLDGTNAVWEGTPAALVSLVSNFGGITQIKFTIDPNTSTPANSCGDGLTWAVNDGVLTISYDGVGTGSMDNYDDCFSMPWYGQNITSVVLPEGLISIGQNAFAFINTFSHITLPSTLQYILMNAFSGCGLTSVTIPENVKGISASAFISSSSLATVTFEPTTPPRVGGNAFEYCNNDLIIHYPCESRAQYYNDMQADIAYYHDKMYNCPAPPSNLHVTELEAPASWSGKSTYLAVADMPGFEETDAELAKTWEAPTDCNSILIYHVAEQYGDDKMYYHYFNAGNFVASEEGWYDLGTVYSNANNGIKTFYTSSGGGSTPAVDPAVQNVIDLINAIPNPVVYNQDCYNALEAARSAYIALSEEQRDQVTNYNDYLAAEEMYYMLADVNYVIEKINEIGDVEFTPACKHRIDYARSEYCSLTLEQKGYVTNYNTLLAAEAAYAALIPVSSTVVWDESILATINVDELGEATYTNGSISLKAVDGRAYYVDNEQHFLFDGSNSEKSFVFSCTSANILCIEITVSEKHEHNELSCAWQETATGYRWVGEATSVDLASTIFKVTGIRFSLGEAFPEPTPTPAQDGDKLPGAFSVSGGTVVYFSKGNLQYLGNIERWHFAENQWTIIGNAQASNNRDLFSWGTGDNPESEDYSTYTEWGNNIEGNWRTLTVEEWTYLFNTRTDASSKYGTATVAGVEGLILLPDVYDGTAINTERTAWNNNVISSSEWAAYEAEGAVFLPAAGLSDAYDVYGVGEQGFYWSSTMDALSHHAISVFYGFDGFEGYWFNQVDAQFQPQEGHSVRLVSETAPTPAPTPVTSYVVEFALGDAEGVAPAALDVTIGEDITMPVNKTMYKEGYTLTGWSDGVNTYAIGESFTPANDAVLTPVFTANEADLLNASTDVTVKWYFGGDNGAPVMHLEGSAGLLVAQATIGDKTVDVKLSIDATSGKFVPQPTTEWAQVRVGTIFTYPYKEGMTVDVHTYSGNVTYYVADGNVTCGTNDYYSFIEVTYPASAPTTAVKIGDPNDADQVTAFLNTYEGQTIDELIIDRPVLNNMYNTLCLPFDMNAAQIAASSLNGVEIREFTGASVEGTTLNLSVGDPVNAVVAGRPYFVKYSAASQLDDLHFEDVTINNALLDNMAVTFDGVTFKGTFTPFLMPNGLNFQGGYLFLGQNNQLFWPNTDNPLKPFRAYFYVDVESSTPGNAPKYRGMPARIVEGKNVATGVENAQSANQSTKVIVNGQLIIIKNDVRYNAQGQIVK